MPGVLIVLIVMSFAALMAKWGMDHDARMKELKRGKANDNSLAMSELRELIRQAVAEANAGLETRIAKIETHLEQGERLLPPGPSRQLEAGDDEPGTGRTMQRSRLS